MSCCYFIASSDRDFIAILNDLKKGLVNVRSLTLSTCVTFSLVAPAVGTVKIEEELAHCLAIDEDTARLACYDELARAAEGAALPALPDSGTGAWQIRQEISPIDDSRNVYLSLGAKNMVDVNGSGSLTRPTLGVRCMENKIEVFINYYSPLVPLAPPKDYIPVLTRFDQHPVQNNFWILSTNKESIFAPDIFGAFHGRLSSQGDYWVDELSGAQKLFVRLAPAGKNLLSATFHLTGSAEAMRPLLEACSW